MLTSARCSYRRGDGPFSFSFCTFSTGGEERRLLGCLDGEGRTEVLINGSLAPIRGTGLPGQIGLREGDG